jgi:hypothetical protein
VLVASPDSSPSVWRTLPSLAKVSAVRLHGEVRSSLGWPLLATENPAQQKPSSRRLVPPLPSHHVKGDLIHDGA